MKEFSQITNNAGQSRTDENGTISKSSVERSPGSHLQVSSKQPSTFSIALKTPSRARDRANATPVDKMFYDTSDFSSKLRPLYNKNH
jgi:hypothetical protein